MKPIFSLSVLGLLMFAGGLLTAPPAQAVPINHCVQVLKDPQVNRETLLNRCKTCVAVKVSRVRAGSANDLPSFREYTMPGRTSLPLPFMGPGTSHIASEKPCAKSK
jgi:hypothetical protein